MASPDKQLIKNVPNIYIAISSICIVFTLIIPLPAFLVQVLMVMNLVFSLMMLLVVLFSENPTEFTVFPSLLLAATVFGLGINVSSTRLILTQNAQLENSIINAFASFVIGAGRGVPDSANLVVGAVIFVILIAVQAFVITKGSTRISEVAARFALDLTTTRMMSVEAEFNSGVITEEEAKKKKDALHRSANFYGAMDGAAKFVSGNLKVGIFITLVNIIAGLIIGVVFFRSPFSEAVVKYTKYTIGDGLLSQIPSLLISVAAGLAVTRSSAAEASSSFGEDIKSQLSKDARVYYVCAGALFVMALLPGFPHFILFVIGGLFALLGFKIQKDTAKKTARQGGKQSQDSPEKTGKAGAAGKDSAEPIIPLDHLSLEIGYTLVPLVTEKKGADLLKRIGAIRKEIALDLGLVAPNIRIMDNMSLDADEYCFKIQGVEVAHGVIQMGSYLGINPGNIKDEIPGTHTTDPTFGLPAIWISEENRAKAEMAGYTVVDPSSIIATHLTQIIKRRAADILTRQMMQDILDSVRKKDNVVVDEVMKSANLGVVQKIMQGLLREQVSIRNTAAILETISDIYPICTNVSKTVESVRQTLGRQIALQYVDNKKILHVMTVDNAIIQKLIAGRVSLVTGPVVSISPEEHRAWIYALTKALPLFHQNGFMPVLLVQADARILVKASTEKEFPTLAVLSYPEIPSDIKVENLGVIAEEDY